MTILDRRRHWQLIFAVGLTLISLAAVLLWLWPTDTDPQGGEGFWCDNVNLEAISNSSGWTVSGHNTVCSGFGGNSAIYIYAHPTGQKERREFLVFRYFENRGEDLPKVEWIGENKLSIQVKHVSQITKLVRSVGPVTVVYHIDKEDFPSGQ